MKALNQGGAISVPQMAKLQADDSVTAQDVAKMLIEADQNGLIDKKEKKSNPLVASALELAPQVVAGSDGAMRKLVGGGGNESGGGSRVRPRSSLQQRKDSLLREFANAGLIDGQNDPRWQALSDEKALGLRDLKRDDATVANAMRLAERIAAGDSTAAQQLLSQNLRLAERDEHDLSDRGTNAVVKRILLNAMADAGLDVDPNNAEFQAMTAQEVARLLADADVESEQENPLTAAAVRLADMISNGNEFAVAELLAEQMAASDAARREGRDLDEEPTPISARHKNAVQDSYKKLQAKLNTTKAMRKFGMMYFDNLKRDVPQFAMLFAFDEPQSELFVRTLAQVLLPPGLLCRSLPLSCRFKPIDSAQGCLQPKSAPDFSAIRNAITVPLG